MNVFGSNNKTSSIVNMLNQKIQATALANTNAQNKTMQMFKDEVKKLDNENKYNEEYFAKNTGFNPAPGTKYADWSQHDLITTGVNSQMYSSEKILKYLQDVSNRAELELKYEQLVAAGDTDPAKQAKNETALKYYRETSNSTVINNILGFYKGTSFVNTYDSFTQGKASEATNFILNDVASLKYLGLENFDNMSATQRKDALSEAMMRVSNRIKETPWKTDVSTYAPSQAQLEQIDQKYSYNYRDIKYTYFESVKALEGSSSIRIQDIKNGSYTPPKNLPPPKQTVRSVYDFAVKWWIDS